MQNLMKYGVSFLLWGCSDLDFDVQGFMLAETLMFQVLYFLYRVVLADYPDFSWAVRR